MPDPDLNLETMRAATPMPAPSTYGNHKTSTSEAENTLV